MTWFGQETWRKRKSSTRKLPWKMFLKKLDSNLTSTTKNPRLSKPSFKQEQKHHHPLVAWNAMSKLWSRGTKPKQINHWVSLALQYHPCGVPTACATVETSLQTQLRKASTTFLMEFDMGKSHGNYQMGTNFFGGQVGWGSNGKKQGAIHPISWQFIWVNQESTPCFSSYL